MANTAKKFTYEQFINKIFYKIKYSGSDWEEQSRKITGNIKKNILKFLTKTDTNFYIDPDSKFYEYCSALKTLLIVCNYGDVEINISKEEIDLIVEGVKTVLNHISDKGYDLSPEISVDEYKDMFLADDVKGQKYAPITQSATCVFSILVYFRRLVNRKPLLFALDENGEGYYYDVNPNKNDTDNLYGRIASTTAELLSIFYSYVNPTTADGKKNYKDMYTGWGFTLSREHSQATTLADTYAVIDALNRFDEAFISKSNKDDDFINSINEWGNKNVVGIETDGYVDSCLSMVYRVALKIYERTKKSFGNEVFFERREKRSGSIEYNTVSSTYEQISNNTSTPVLFNPLYVALITLYGYTDKELIIAELMDNPKVFKRFYDSYYEEESSGFEKKGLISEDGKNKIKCIREYAEELIKNYKVRLIENKIEIKNENDLKEAVKKAVKNFEDAVAILIDDKHNGIDGNLSTAYKEEARKNCYEAARVFQKYLSDYDKDLGEMQNIPVYRDYYNKVKDAIDQVQVMYRKFKDASAFEKVSTDYLFVSEQLDMKADENGKNIPKLNRKKIVLNSLLPILLSSKILIVNALIKYPQADMQGLFEDIKESRLEISGKDGQRNNKYANLEYELGRAWLWNENKVDMNSTSRHVETIMYDYFDYYEKYELGLAELFAIKKAGEDDTDDDDENNDQTGEGKNQIVIDKDNLNFGIKTESGDIKNVDGESIEDMNLLRLILGLTNRKANDLREQRDKDINELKEKIKTLEEEKEKKDEEIAEIKAKKDEEIERLKKEIKNSVDEIKNDRVYRLGDKVQNMIREESKQYFTELASLWTLFKFNTPFSSLSFNKADNDINAEKLFENPDKVVLPFDENEKELRSTQELSFAIDFWEKLKKEYLSLGDDEAAKAAFMERVNARMIEAYDMSKVIIPFGEFFNSGRMLGDFFGGFGENSQEIVDEIYGRSSNLINSLFDLDKRYQYNLDNKLNERIEKIENKLKELNKKD